MLTLTRYSPFFPHLSTVGVLFCRLFESFDVDFLQRKDNDELDLYKR